MPIFTNSTAEALYNMGPDARFELIEGELSEYPFHSGLHGAAAGLLVVRIGAYLASSPLGKLYAGQVGCVLARDPDTVLAPDLAFIRHDRLEGPTEEGFLRIVPDFVAEILEPWDSKAQIERRISIYRQAGVEQVWICDPIRRLVQIHSADGPARSFIGNDPILGGNLFPGLDMRASGLF